MITVTNIYDNISCHDKFIPDWGFSCIIEHPEKRIMFDTGAKPEVLEKNLELAQIDTASIDIIIISHKHWDHKGGVSWLVKQNPNVKVYMSKTWRNSLEKSLGRYTENIYTITQNTSINDIFHLVISKNLWISELVLAIRTSNGIIAITGCSHTGIHRIIKNTSCIMKEKVYAVFGGFHLFRSSIKNIYEVVSDLKETKVKFVAPCHCTGDKALAILKKEFAENFLINGVGAKHFFKI